MGFTYALLSIVFDDCVPSFAFWVAFSLTDSILCFFILCTIELQAFSSSKDLTWLEMAVQRKLQRAVLSKILEAEESENIQDWTTSVLIWNGLSKIEMLASCVRRENWEIAGFEEWDLKKSKSREYEFWQPRSFSLAVIQKQADKRGGGNTWSGPWNDRCSKNLTVPQEVEDSKNFVCVSNASRIDTCRTNASGTRSVFTAI